MEKENNPDESLSVEPQGSLHELHKPIDSEIKLPAEADDEPEVVRSRSSSVPPEKYKEVEVGDSCPLEESTLDPPEDESDNSKLISDALQQEDEFLEYLMSLPAASTGAKEKSQNSAQNQPASAQPVLMRSISTFGGTVSTGAKVGLDHLDNLCKLMEQLGDLREQNSKLQRRVQYLEDLKNLQEMHKQLQEETKIRELQEVAFLRTLQQHRQLSAKRHQSRRLIEETFPTRRLVTKREGSEDSLINDQMTVTANDKRSDKCKSMANGKFRQSLLRYQPRERSRSVGIEEIKPENEICCQVAVEDTKQRNQQSKQQRRSVVGITSGTKAKVSKWTKVKEAFRWEKASVVMLPEAKSQDSGIGGISGSGSGGGGGCPGCCGDDSRYLRVPSGESKSGDNLLSVSPVDSVLSGHSSSACSSGGQSPGYLPCQHPLSDFGLSHKAALSSSSSSEDLDLDLNFTDILAEYGPQRSASATDSTGGRLLVQDTRRRSLSQMPEEEDASRRSKSLDGDATIGNSAFIARHLAAKDGTGAGKLPHKSHKTPWGKVKDIIQTRKDSLKKRHRHGKSESKSTSEAAASDHEEDATVSETPLRDSPDKEPETSVAKTLPSKPRIEVSGDGTGSRTSTSKRQHSKKSTASLDSHIQANESPTSRRLTPVLTITLPSTEELRSVERKPPPSPQSEERLHKISTASAPGNNATFRNNGNSEQAATEDSNRCEAFKSQVSLPRPASSSAGTSPPVHRRPSKWTKVKKAFLTSSSTPGRRDDDGSGRISNSVPSSPNRNSSFFDEVDTDELSSGEYGDVISRQKSEEGELEGGAVQKDTPAHSTSIHAEIQKNYEELQQKLSQEFHKKLHEWEKMKASSFASSSCRGPSGEEGYHDKGFRRKMEEWERKHPQHHQSSGSKHRDSVAYQQLDEDNLSPDFRKKLQEWQRIKKSMPVGTTPQSTGDTYAVPPQFRKKIAEWQLWRSGSGKSEGQNRAEDQHEWERVKAASSSPSPETVASQMESSERAGGTKTPSPSIVRKDSTGNSKGSGKKTGNSKSPADSPGKEKCETSGVVCSKSAGAVGKPHQKGKSQKEKELQWLEKELHKIEREKQRLEREREKYLEREARLEKMRRAMGSGQSKQEVLIQTSTGFFRFQGISEKFTRRLYEWEKARGIGPEASTFALLDPGYRPAGNGASASHGGDSVDVNLLSRSKSASSVTNLGTGVTNVGTSSLSLNDVEVLEQAEAAALEDSRAASEPHLRVGEDGAEDDEPAAVIVDIEDVIEETAAPLPVTPVVQSQTPVYCYAPEEVTRLIDSSGSDSERDSSKLVQRNDSVRTESSYKLLEENMSLLNKLKLKEDICRKLENEIENLEGKIDDVAKTHKQELQRLRREETDRHVHSEGEQEANEVTSGPHEELIAELRARIRELEQRQETLLREGETLQNSFAQHSEQQAALAQNLVGKMKQLQEVNNSMASCEQAQPLQQSSSGSTLQSHMDAVSLVQDLSTQLLTLAEKLELALAERSREVHNLRIELHDRGRTQHKLRLGHNWFSEEGMSVSMSSLAEPETIATSSILPRQSSEELSQLPSLLTNKVLELKEGLNYLCTASGVSEPELPDTIETTASGEKEDAEATTTFVLKFPKKSDEDTVKPEESSEMKHDSAPTVVQVDSEGNTSPVTCVTITPAFWKKRDSHQATVLSKEVESIQKLEVKSTESSTPREEQTSPVNRDSFCSALSSASATSSVCDDEEEEEDPDKEGGSDVSDVEPTEENPSSPAAGNDESAYKKDDVSEASVNESDREKSSDDEDEDDEDDDDDEDAVSRNITKCHSASIKSEDAHGNESNRTFAIQESGSNFYETEVHLFKSNNGSNNGRQRKLLKTRRISDTNVGYKRDNEPKSNFSQETMKPTSNAPVYNGENGRKLSATDNYQRRVIHSNSRTAMETDDDIKAQTVVKQNHYISCNARTEFRQDYSNSRENLSEESPPLPGSSYTIHNQPLSNISYPLPTPENVFVKTTRKIFSPVRRDSKGKTSSVISYVVSETTLPSAADTNQFMHPNDQSTPLISPVVNVIKRDERDSSPVKQSAGINISNRSPPSWMFTRKRSQSSSPALTRRKSSITNKSSSETISASDSNSEQSKVSLDSNSREELNKNRTPSLERKFEAFTSKQLCKLKEQNENIAINEISDFNNISLEEQTKQDTRTECDSIIENRKSEKYEPSVPSIRTITPSASFPPLPQSPNPSRRDLIKVPTKETAPSIRMMIAKYNQKLTEQDGPGGRSPEICGSGSASPVAWRSPVAERRVRAQMEKYQEEVRRVLQQDGRKTIMRYGGSEVQKSASAGVIRAPESPSTLKADADTTKESSNAVVSKPPSVLTKPRGILKSSSAGAIKSSSTTITPVVTESLKPAEAVKEIDLGESNVKETILQTSPSMYFNKPPSPNLNISPSPSSPSSPELGLHHSSPQPSRLRALRIQKAKEEFLTRGPGGQSWTSETGTPSTDTPSASVSPEPFWSQPSTSEGVKDYIRTGARPKVTGSENTSRLSQVSVGSESSYDGSVMVAGTTYETPNQIDDEGILLVKSASAGMINVDPSTYRKFYDDRAGSDQPSISDSQESKSKSQPCGKFGISSITSRFRRVKMRKKEKEGGKMNAVSTLCRQSLLVDLHLSKGGSSRDKGGADKPGPSTSKSCPSSPVLQRSGEKPGSSSAHTSWIFNPARKIFKPK